jgi:hypothetical protein
MEVGRYVVSFYLDHRPLSWPEIEKITIDSLHYEDVAWGLMRYSGGNHPLHIATRADHPLVPHHHQVVVLGSSADLGSGVAPGQDPLVLLVETSRGVAEHDVADQLVAHIYQGDIRPRSLGQGMAVAGCLIGGFRAIGGDQNASIVVPPSGVGRPHDQNVYRRVVSDLTGKAAEVEAAGPAHAVVTDHEQVAPKLSGSSDDCLCYISFTPDRLTLDAESTGSVGCLAENPLATFFVVADVDDDQLRSKMESEPGRGCLRHLRGWRTISPYDDLAVGVQNGLRTIR